MLFKLSLKNMKKSFKDYAIYFMTLILGVAIFYVFNSMDSQQAMMQVSVSSKSIIQLMLTTLSGVSVFVSFILGFLIIYANNFLIKRRKKEFGIYMTLGMGKRQISKILLIETLLIGFISLVIGLAVGVFASQLMSVLVAKMFESDMSQYQFVLSQSAMIKTIIYFGIMYVLVMLFNAVSISKYKLIDLITAIRKNEKVKIKNPFVCVIMFLISVVMLVYAYINVMNPAVLNSPNEIYGLIAMGAIATFLFFWSLSGFILKVVQSSKKLYYKNLNMFVLRQINSKINTTVFSMTIICLMLFVTIGVLSSAVSLNQSVTKDLKELTPVDLSIQKKMDLPNDAIYTQARREDSNISIIETLKNANFEVEKDLKDIVEITAYTSEEITLKDTLKGIAEVVAQNYRFLQTDTLETLIGISDYNKIAKLFGHEELDLKDNEYLVLCDYENMKELRNNALKENDVLLLKGKEYVAKEKQCVKGFIQITTQHLNAGIILLPDSAIKGLKRESNYLNVNYNATTEEGKQEINKKIQELSKNKLFVDKDIVLDAMTKITIYEFSRGIGAIVTFIGMYLGVIFLISSAAILALKELSESSDNKERYTVLRKIGADEKMIHKALLTQIGIFFIIPLALAIVHSIFGLQFAQLILGTIGKQNMLASVPYTAGFVIIIYGGYFIATYIGSKNIIKEER